MKESEFMQGNCFLCKSWSGNLTFSHIISDTLNGPRAYENGFWICERHRLDHNNEELKVVREMKKSNSPIVRNFSVGTTSLAASGIEIPVGGSIFLPQNIFSVQGFPRDEWNRKAMPMRLEQMEDSEWYLLTGSPFAKVRCVVTYQK